MAFLSATDALPEIMAAHPTRLVTSDNSDVVAELPPGYEEMWRPTLTRVKRAAKAVERRLLEDDHNNQWIVLRSMTEELRALLDNDKRALGVEFRFQWDHSTGIIKVIPSIAHDVTTTNVFLMIRDQAIAMGVNSTEMAWMATSTHRGISNGKEPDQALSPGARRPLGGLQVGWPTFVIEAGLSESLPRLRADAKWWFRNSSGDVRIVLVVSIRRTRQPRIVLEKWQLAPAGTTNPMSPQQLQQLCAQNPLPPTTKQQPSTQQPFAAQTITLTANAVDGAPLILPFQALMDRPPRQNESDFVISGQALIDTLLPYV